MLTELSDEYFAQYPGLSGKGSRKLDLSLMPSLCRFLLGLFFNPEDGSEAYSSETLVDFKRTTRCYIPEVRTLRFLLLLSLQMDCDCVKTR
jgi:hypothetical protein